jgi:hypothetical protein
MNDTVELSQPGGKYLAFCTPESVSHSLIGGKGRM